MRTRIVIALSLLVILTSVHPAAAAEKLSVKAMADRLAAKPTGEDAKALAEDIRTWFGKDRAGRNNVVNGANPKVEGLETAWAIEAPGAKRPQVAFSDGKTVPLTQVGDTPIFAAMVSFARRVGLRYGRTSTTANRGRRQANSKSTRTSPSSPRSPACPRAS